MVVNSKEQEILNILLIMKCVQFVRFLWLVIMQIEDSDMSFLKCDKIAKTAGKNPAVNIFIFIYMKDKNMAEKRMIWFWNGKMVRDTVSNSDYDNKMIIDKMINW